MLSQLMEGFSTVFTVHALLVITLGALIGIIGGAMPGMSSASAVALALPFTFAMDTTLSIILLAAIYSGSTYGGSITATLLNTPGTPESAVMTFDGYALTKQGKAGKALWAALIAGTIGGLLGTFLLIWASVPLAKEALNFGPPEYFALAFFGLTVLALLIDGSIVKGLICCTFGLLIATVGFDPITGLQRMTFGLPALFDGFQFIPVLIGLFAISEAFELLSRNDLPLKLEKSGLWSTRLSWKELKGLLKYIFVGTGIGVFIGIKPGGGATIASIISYSVAKQMSPNRERFGTGQLEGLAAPEAADKATVGAALIPMLTLGLPASATSAVLIGAFTLHGIQPGPSLFTTHSDLVYGLFASLILANVAVFLLGMIGIPLFVRLSTIPKSILGAAILMLTLFGSYAYESSLNDVWVAMIFGMIGYAMKKYKFPTAPLVLGLVLAPLLESNFRKSLILSKGDFTIFFDRGISLVLIIISLLSLVISIYWSYRQSRKANKAGTHHLTEKGPNQP
jgi:putative tricarboxylic transport membrane protein